MAKKEETPLTATQVKAMFDATDKAHFKKDEAAQLADLGEDLKILPMTPSMFYIPSTQIEELEKKMAEVIKKFNVLVDLITEEAK